MSKGIASLRGYQEGGDPWPISGTPTEWTPEKIRKLNEVWSAMLDAQERRSGIRGEHVALVDSLQQLRSELLEGTSDWYHSYDSREPLDDWPSDTWRGRFAGKPPGVDIQYGMLPNYNRGETWRDVPLGEYSWPWDQISFPEDTTIANRLNPDDPWMGGKEYPRRSTTIHEFGHASDPKTSGYTRIMDSNRPFLDILDDIRNETSEYPQRDTILAEPIAGPQSNVLRQIYSQSNIYEEDQEFAEVFKDAFEFLQSPSSRATGTVVPEYYKTIVRELLKLPVYQAHPLRLREGLRR
tara:strand:- start:15898 stop:16782 length:885 start_codon:yes stop_codon:yes gene_type:complete